MNERIRMGLLLTVSVLVPLGLAVGYAEEKPAAPASKTENSPSAPASKPEEKPAAPAAQPEEKPVTAAPAPKEFPQITIRNDQVQVTLYLPDAEKGFYRGQRFDGSGLIVRAEFDGRTVFGPFRTKYDALNHDNVVGPADEFDMENSPPGFDEAKPGEPFVKIGVGLLLKGADATYGFWRPYPFAKPPAWQVTSGPDWVEFKQEVSHDGWGYVWTKRIHLVAGTPTLAIAYRLENTGTKAINTLFYCHNFITLDDDPVGPNYRIAFPFDVTLRKDARGKLKAKGKEIVLTDVLKNESAWAVLEGGTGKVEDNQVLLANRRTGTAVSIQGDQPLAEWRFFAESTAACPEPFLRIQLAPGQEKVWHTDYVLLVLAKEAPK